MIWITPSTTLSVSILNSTLTYDPLFGRTRLLVCHHVTRRELRPPAKIYSAECAEGVFCELRPKKEFSKKFASLGEYPSVPGQPPVELGERRSAHAVDQHGGAYDEATDHPCFLDTRLPQGEGRVVERRGPYRTEPSEEEHVLRPLSKRSEQRPQRQHSGQPPKQKHRH